MCNCGLYPKLFKLALHAAFCVYTLQYVTLFQIGSTAFAKLSFGHIKLEHVIEHQWSFVQPFFTAICMP